MSQHMRTSSYIAPSPNPSSIPRKRNLSASAIPLRPPPNLRTNTSTPSTPQPVKEEEISDNENDGKDDYGDLGVTGENREEENKEERERLKILLEAFTPEQMQRYEVFRRANLNKSGIKKLSNQILSQSIPQNIAIVISGFAKVFVGEIVEKARDVQMLQGSEGPLQPEHLREAWRLYKLRGSRNAGVPESGRVKRLFK